MTTVLVSIRRRNVAATVNGLGALVLTVLPGAVELLLGTLLARSVVLGPVLPVWLGTAAVLHSVGMVELYESTWWWDHLTHTVSAALLAALVYAGLLVALPTGTGFDRSPGVIAAMTVAFTLAGGVFWELLELVLREIGEQYGIDPLLIYYGWRDTAADLGFDVVGALLVIVFDVTVFRPVLQQVPALTRAVLLAAVGFVLVGSVLLALVLGYGSSTRQYFE